MDVVIGMIAGVAGAALLARLLRGMDQGWIVNGLAGLLGAGLVLAFLALPGAQGLTHAAREPLYLTLTIQAVACLIAGGLILATVGFLRDLLIK